MSGQAFQMITERVGYFPGHVNIGLVIGEHGAILIDSGLDTQNAKKIKKGLDAIAQPLCAIIQTHSHADHFGGNAYLLGCWPEARVYAPPLEEAIIRNPILEPIYLNMGAAPLEDLKNKFLLAQPSRVDHLLPLDEGIEIADVPFFILSLPGHSWQQVGVVCDEICFAADSYLGEEVLEKHKLPFLVDANETLLSLHKLLATNYRGYLPGHGAYTTTSQDAVNKNIAWHERIFSVICDILVEERTPDEALTLLCERLHISIENASSYVLFRTAFMGYLVGLQKTKRVAYRFEQNRWLWRTVQDGAEGAER
ncbi:MBL fold metallo-hydrolase [Brevibacillus formosus]|uniref:Hydrolase glyoxylase n=2 Tax=Brevibacillus formosus TaxID=54913 RepID=A0A837KVU8_9BACL|nr:MBL fold metallo-hydrolase [Brevibacillus formosus]KLI01167.1 hydrolase glyoxylase [Brevibacillus formosus]MED1955814.1 MBL fold metallo-hydrolase [Brevibacillus formosus]PSK00150.1 MBL fold metallo-hydrolase [Brevibacillus formosus]GED59089.1 MBL fold metallo-hydrolase [Brevibacillus formosus]